MPLCGPCLQCFFNILDALALSRKYGNIFSLKLKDLNVVCITDFKLIKEVSVFL